MQKYKNLELDGYMSICADCIDARGQVGFAVAHNYRYIREAIQEYTKKKEAIIKKYGTDNGKGNYSISDTEGFNKANEELTPFAELQVSCDIMKLPESAFKDCGLTGRQIYSLQEFMLEKATPKSSQVEVDPAMPPEDDRFGI